MRRTEDQRAYLPQRRRRGPGPSTIDTTAPVPNEVRTVRVGSAAIIVVRGEVDVTSAEETLGAVIRAIGETSYDRILVDLADVTFVDAAGLGAVISARRLANGVGIPLDLVTPSEAVSRLLRLTHADQNFRTYDSLDAAIEESRETLSPALLSDSADPRARQLRSDSVGSPGGGRRDTSLIDEEPPPPDQNQKDESQGKRMRDGRRARTHAA